MIAAIMSPVMLALFTDLPDPLRDLRERGIEAKLGWAGDQDHAVLLFMAAEPENLARLEQWAAARPKWVASQG